MSEIADEKLQTVSFHDNLVAMYYIENSWCEAVPNTVLAVAVLGGVWEAVRCGVRIAKLGYLPDYLDKPAPKDEGAAPASFGTGLSEIGQISELRDTTPASKNPSDPAQNRNREYSIRYSLTPRVLNIVHCH